MKISIVWLRQDLRLNDNPALYHAAQATDSVIPLYIHAPAEAAPWAAGAAAGWWRHHSLAALRESLQAMGSDLVIRRGPSLAALLTLIRESGATAVYWNRLYEPQLARRDRDIAATLAQLGVELHEYDGALLHAPGSVLNRAGTAFRVFTPFWRACRQRGLGAAPLPAPARLGSGRWESETLESLALLPHHPWHHRLAEHWRPGEDHALQQLHAFRATGLAHYAAQRDRPGQRGTSRLSPHLACGELSPRQVVAAVLEACHEAGAPDDAVDTFLSELGWREFAAHTLHHFPRSSDVALNPRFEHFPWQRDATLLRAWQRGNTGIPIVDAGMRELWRTGWMHNRVRMIVASFLTKNALQPWQDGAEWFWDTLVDADLASNSFNWQWVAGCGLDAAPYFRIFNPVRQGERFDPEGAYLQRWLPQLSRLPLRWRHCPWLAPAAIQRHCGVRIGSDYPAPVVEPASSRARALALFRQLPVTAKED